MSKLIDVSRMVQFTAPKGATGSFAVKCDQKDVTVILTVKSLPEDGGKFSFVIPWGAVYGKMKKLKEQSK